MFAVHTGNDAILDDLGRLELVDVLQKLCLLHAALLPVAGTRRDAAAFCLVGGRKGRASRLRQALRRDLELRRSLIWV